MPPRPAVFVFDVIETLFSLDAVGECFQEIRQPESAMPLFFAQLLRDAFALECSGVFRPFQEVARGALGAALGDGEISDAESGIERVLGAFGELEPHADVAPALGRAQAAGIPLFALTNGSEANSTHLLQRAELDRYFERVISIDDVGHWKPHPEVYHHAARIAGESPARMALIAAHAWDTHGAGQTGYATGLVVRSGKRPNAALGAPTVHGASLLEVVEALLVEHS